MRVKLRIRYIFEGEHSLLRLTFHALSGRPRSPTFSKGDIDQTAFLRHDKERVRRLGFLARRQICGRIPAFWSEIFYEPVEAPEISLFHRL